MAPKARVRKSQAPDLLRALDDALTAGESIDAALARLSVSRSKLEREMTRDEAVRRRIEDALLVGPPRPKRTTGRAAKSSTAPAPIAPAAAAEPRKTTRRAAKSSTAPSPIAPATAEPKKATRHRAAKRSAPAADAAPAAAAAQLTTAPEAALVRRHSIDNIATGTGRLVFGSRRPQPLAMVRRMALRSAPPRALDPNTPRAERLAIRDWLPALLVLVADVVLALAVAGNLLVVGVVALIAAAYVTVIRLLSRATPPAVPASGRAAPAIVSARPPLVTPPAGTVRGDLTWVQRTIAEPMPGQRPPPPPRDRQRG